MDRVGCGGGGAAMLRSLELLLLLAYSLVLPW
jgi:hypothetical protein